jgi:hypothetical protein
MTTDEAAMHRILAEKKILDALHELSRMTGLDIARVEVFLVVKATKADDPKRHAEAVRIELCV